MPFPAPSLLPRPAPPPALPPRARPPPPGGPPVGRPPSGLRREIGECLREGSRLGGVLYLEHGAERFRLVFDCAACEMSLVKEPRREGARPGRRTPADDERK